MNPEDKKQINVPWWEPAMEVFAKVSSWIVAPIVLALLLGKYLDNRYHTRPWFFLGLTAIAFAISMFGIVKESFVYIRAMEEEAKKVKKDTEINK